MFGDALAFHLIGSTILVIVGLALAVLVVWILLGKRNTTAKKIVGFVLLNIVIVSIAIIFVKNVMLLMIGGGR